jgi:2,5-diketo-D-gluconate reductase B
MTLVVEAHGAIIPAIGLGTWELRGRGCARIVEQALRLGYRHLDTAQMYDNEREVGEGLRASGVPREEVFVTTKVWPTHFAPPDLERSVKESVARLRLDHVDLLLLHWPSSRVPLSETVRALAKMKRLGFTRQIGVSNFDPQLLQQAVRLCPEPLVCDQVEYHAYLDQTALKRECAALGIAVVAYSPIAKGRVAKDRKLIEIGRRHHKTASQVALRWLVQQGVSAIPRTSRVERLAENLAVFDFELTETEMADVTAIGAGRRATE